MRDAQGYELTGATVEAAAAYDRAVRAFALAYGDPLAELESARVAAPDCTMVHLARAWLSAMSNDPAGVASARTAVVPIRAMRMNEREASHLAALAHAAEGRWAAAVGVLDRHLMRFPLDLMGHQLAMRLDGFLGRFEREAARAARALPLWPKDLPGWGILYSFWGFGLEEAGDYARAEDVSREAAELEPYGYWPHHSVSHVLEMTGRPAEGLAWMAGREPLWSGKASTNRVHIHWHKALFHVELGEREAALAIFDGPILETLRPVGTSLCNGTALLWRLEMLGCEAGERWQKLRTLWEGRANGGTSVFNDIHYAMTTLRAGDTAAFEQLRGAMLRTASDSEHQAATYRSVGLPVIEGIHSFHHGACDRAVDHLLAARAELSRMGGSKAQRDIVEWTLTEAAARAGLRGEALSLANERLSARPASVPNRRLYEAAERIAA